MTTCLALPISSEILNQRNWLMGLRLQYSLHHRQTGRLLEAMRDDRISSAECLFIASGSVP